MSDAETLVVCMRVQDLARPIKGAIQRQCSACGNGIWVSPSTIKNMIDLRGAFRLQCGHCAIPVIIREKAKPIAITDEQKLEIAAELVRRGRESK